MFKLYLLSVPLMTAYGALLFANLGDNVTFPCFHDSNAKYLSWYRQVAGGKPEMILSFYKYSHQQDRNHRFSLHTGSEGFTYLNILNVQHVDSAMYYCGETKTAGIEFHNGTFLALKEASGESFLQQPMSVSVSLGDSATLNCTVHRGTSDGDHRVYWFRKDSTDSQLGLMYSPSHDSSSQCEKSFEAPAQSCVYKFSRRNVTLSDAGMYYCAVASCGEIQFGKGTKLDVGEKQPDSFPILVCCLVAALLVSVILNMFLVCVLCKKAEKKCFPSGGPHLQPSAPKHTADSQDEESDDLQYVAVNFKNKQCKGRRQRRTEEETVYSGLKLSDLD